MRAIILAAALAALPGLALADAHSAGPEMAAGDGRVLVTIGGNDGPMTPAAEGAQSLFAKYEVDLTGARGLDMKALAELEAGEIVSNLPGTQTEVTFSGPRLAEIMRLAGAEGKAALPMALDGYQPEIAWEDIEAHDPILATHADGAPLAIGDIGPAMIIFPAIEDAETADRLDAARVWAVFYVGIGE